MIRGSSILVCDEEALEDQAESRLGQYASSIGRADGYLVRERMWLWGYILMLVREREENILSFAMCFRLDEKPGLKIGRGICHACAKTSHKPRWVFLWDLEWMCWVSVISYSAKNLNNKSKKPWKLRLAWLARAEAGIFSQEINL
jgi:hypothetical protein